MTPQLPYEIWGENSCSDFLKAFVMNGLLFLELFDPRVSGEKSRCLTNIFYKNIARGTLGIWYPSCLTPLKSPYTQ